MSGHVSLTSYLLVGALLFLSGLYAVMTRRNAVWILMGVELILNSASLNFAAFSRYAAGHAVHPAAESGMIGSLLIIILAAAEAAVALAILIGIYRNFRTIETEDLQELHG